MSWRRSASQPDICPGSYFSHNVEGRQRHPLWLHQQTHVSTYGCLVKVKRNWGAQKLPAGDLPLLLHNLFIAHFVDHCFTVPRTSISLTYNRRCSSISLKFLEPIIFHLAGKKTRKQLLWAPRKKRDRVQLVSKRFKARETLDAKENFCFVSTWKEMFTLKETNLGFFAYSLS